MTDQIVQPETEQTPIQRVGGPGAVKMVIEDFYTKVESDARLAPYFEGVDMIKQRNHLATLVIVLLKGDAVYTGRDLGEAHRGLHITDEAYDAVVQHLVESLQTFQVPGDIIASLGETVAAVRPQIVRDGAEASA